eukprot:COSAG01_NODE_2752_length_7143_cov_35.819989_1_plen_217_part_00
MPRRKQDARQLPGSRRAATATVQHRVTIPPRGTAESGYKFIGPRSYGCALQCFEVICHALGCPETAKYLDKSFAKRAKGAQLDMNAIGRKLTDANNETGVRLNMVREPAEHEVPLTERKGGPLVYAVNQPGVFILVTSPVPATVINGVQINHAVVYVKLGNTNGATGTQRGLWMDPHRTDGRTLEVDKADFADTEEAKARLREAVDEHMGERTTVV